MYTLFDFIRKLFFQEKPPREEIADMSNLDPASIKDTEPFEEFVNLCAEQETNLTIKH